MSDVTNQDMFFNADHMANFSVFREMANYWEVRKDGKIVYHESRNWKSDENS